MSDNAYQGELVDHKESKMLRIAGAFVFATGMYSLLFIIYIVFRLIFNPDIVRLNDLFIDYIPYFTFYITGILMLAVSSISICLYIVIRKFSRSKSRHPKAIIKFQWVRKRIFRKPNGIENRDVSNSQPRSERLSILEMSVLVTWLFSMSIWAYICFFIISHPLSFLTTHPLSVQGWITASIMFVIGYISIMILHYEVSRHRNILNS